MFSQRFQLAVALTRHARERMAARHISETLLLDIIDTGMDREVDDGHHWLYKHYPDRSDNLLCAAAVVENVLVVKTVMHHWEITP
jgi:hypothetical protein